MEGAVLAGKLAAEVAPRLHRRQSWAAYGSFIPEGSMKAAVFLSPLRSMELGCTRLPAKQLACLRRPAVPKPARGCISSRSKFFSRATHCAICTCDVFLKMSPQGLKEIDASILAKKDDFAPPNAFRRDHVVLMLASSIPKMGQ